MSVHVRDPEVAALLRSYAEEKRVGIDEAIRLAVNLAREAEDAARANERAREEKLAKMRAVCEEVASWPRSGLKADKAFFDEMYED